MQPQLLSLYAIGSSLLPPIKHANDSWTLRPRPWTGTVFKALPRSRALLRGDRWPHLYGNFAAYQSTNDAFIDAHIVRVSGQVAGRLQSVYLDDNQSLNKGDLIVELDPHDFNAAARQKAAALASSQAQAAAAQAAVQEAIAHVKTEEATVESDQATAAADAAQNDKAQSDLEHRWSDRIDESASKPWGSVGISAVTTMVSRGAQTHQALMVGQMGQFNPVFNEQIAKMQSAIIRNPSMHLLP